MEAFGAVCTKQEYQDFPEDAVRPFDINRCGTVIADGGSAMVLISEAFYNKIKESNGEQKGDKIHCELAGYG